MECAVVAEDRVWRASRMEDIQVGADEDAKAESAVNNAQGRHEPQGPVLPPDGVDLKLSVAMEAFRGERGAGGSSPDNPDQLEKLDKGRKRRKHQHRQRHVRNNKKGWLWRRELAEATAGAGAQAGGGSPTRTAGLPTALPAPNNTTQFIMEDHTDLQDLDLEAQRGARTTRSRDPSFSIDSEDESSSYEEELYLSKEFSNTYEDVHVERLGTMTKLDLIQEYLQLEQRVNVLEKKLTGQNTSSTTADMSGNGVTGTDSDSEIAEGEVPVEPAMVEKIRIFQEEIQKLVVENELLVQENQRLQSSSSLVRPSSSSLSSSIDSESDSSTTSGSSSSSSSSGKSKASKGSRCSKASRSSSLKSRENVIPQTIGPENDILDVEMTAEDQSNTLTPLSQQDQEMETESPGEVLKEPSNQESSPAFV